ncbi:MipA/OmpV family protein [Alteromonas sp. KUL42]|uniref:MipA/OmpV family protein n=1 Tax=Alteromonas sp. KUL42 TaxID=2480797 RepID=UPI0013EF9AA6|nr:MipA/OmpV family protein [Alteromonas sp. KUL42]
MKVFWVVFLLLISQAVWAEEERVSTEQLQLGVSLGFGGKQLPIRGLDNIIIPVVPHIQYYTDNWYFDNFSVGYNLLENESVLIDIVGTLNHDGFYFELDGLSRFLAEPAIRDKPRPSQPPPPDFVPSKPIERNLSYMGGFGVTAPLSFATFSGGVFTDVSGVHDGQEIRFSVLKGESFGRWQVSGEMGMTYKTQEIANYYFVQRDNEFTTRVARIELDDLLNTHVKFKVQYWVSEHTSIGAILTYEKLDSELRKSVIVDRTELLSGFLGVTRWF